MDQLTNTVQYSTVNLNSSSNTGNLIVHFAKQKEPECSEREQFGKFFHAQLDSILRGSLMKFNARKLKECGEDILIDVSEILFNELSFFKLMQDLNRSVKVSSKFVYLDIFVFTLPNTFEYIW